MEEKEVSKPEFKKPLLIGKVGKFPKKIVAAKREEKQESVSTEGDHLDKLESTNERAVEGAKAERTVDKAEEKTESGHTLPYKEPHWSGLPENLGRDYEIEVLKSGKIVDKVNVMGKAFYVFGRLPNCDVPMAHPTISR